MDRIHHYHEPEGDAQIYSNFSESKDFISCLEQCGRYTVAFRFVEMYKGIPPLSMGHLPYCDRILQPMKERMNVMV
jgi:hypothetical protein